MRSFLLNKELQEKDLVPCYFLYGEETFLAQEFLGQLRELLAPADAPEFNVERFHYEDTSWPEVIDLARTAPFLFAPWRIIALELPPSGKREQEGEEEKGKNLFAERDERLVRDYLAAPSPRTVLIIIFPGRPNLGRRVVKFFCSFPPSIVLSKELKPLKDRNLWAWMDRAVDGWGKTITAEGRERLVELVGNDLRRLGGELDKLATFVGDKKSIDEDDVNAASGWTKDLESWELEQALESGDVERSLGVLAKLFAGGAMPEYVMGIVGNFFRALLAAQEGLREGRDKKDIFRQLRPQISESYGKWYYDRLNEFFAAVQGLTRQDLDDCLEQLGRADYRLKSSDVSGRTELEAFIVDYGRRRRLRQPIWRERS